MTLQTTPLLDELAAHGQACMQAIKAAAQSQTLHPEVLEALYSFGFNALTAHKFEEAHGLFSYLLAQNPANSNFLAGMGHALSGLGQWHAAAQMHSTAACFNPDNAGHYIALAEALIEIKELEKAEFVLAVAEYSAAPGAVVQRLRTKLLAVKELMAHAN